MGVSYRDPNISIDRVWLIYIYIFKGLITVGRELRQQHPSDLLSGAGTLEGRPRRTTNHEGVVAVTPDRPWSIPIITWLNNVVWNVFTTKYIQNHHQI